MNAINWFELPTRDLDRADRFYAQVLGTPLKREIFMGVPHAIFPFDEKDGVGGALVHSPEHLPSEQGSILYLHTAQLDACLGRVEKAGGSVVKGRTEIGPMGSYAWIRDTEGNVVGLHQP